MCNNSILSLAYKVALWSEVNVSNTFRSKAVKPSNLLAIFCLPQSDVCIFLCVGEACDYILLWREANSVAGVGFYCLGQSPTIHFPDLYELLSLLILAARSN